MTDIRQGGCLCGKARYKIDVDGSTVGNCHCITCRKQSGAPYETYVGVNIDRFMWQAQPAGYIQTGPDSGRYFCKECGSPLTFVNDDTPYRIYVTLATVDNPSGMVPTYEIFTRSRMDGVPPVDGAKQFEQDD